MSVLEEFGDKLAALRRWVRETSPQFESVEAYEAAPLPEAEIRRAERQFDVTLPPEYRAFLGRFGSGRAWPGNTHPDHLRGLTPASREPFPLSRPMLGVCSPQAARLSDDEKWEEYGRLLELWKPVPKDHGVLQFCDYGCAIFGALVLNGPFTGRVWVVQGDTAYYGPFGGGEMLNGWGTEPEGTPTDTPRDYSFLEWYGNWLDCQLSHGPGD